METPRLRSQRIAALQYDPAFNDLLTVLDEHIDRLALMVENEPDKTRREDLVAEWRHFRKTVRLLRTEPARVYEELCADLGVENALDPNPIESMGTGYTRMYGER